MTSNDHEEALTDTREAELIHWIAERLKLDSKLINGISEASFFRNAANDDGTGLMAVDVQLLIELSTDDRENLRRMLNLETVPEAAL